MLSRIHLAKNTEVSLANVMRSDAFEDGYVHRWTIPETTIAQVIAGRYEIEHAGGHLFIEPGEMYIVQANTTVAITHHFAKSGMRIREACRLLLHTQQKIHRIAEATGFGNAYYFCRVFKTLNGVSPGEYRKANSLLRYSHSAYDFYRAMRGIEAVRCFGVRVRSNG